jgi:hypothetical protein
MDQGLDFFYQGVIWGTLAAHVIVSSFWSMFGLGQQFWRTWRSAGGLFYLAGLASLGEAIASSPVDMSLNATCAAVGLCVVSLVLQAFLLPISNWGWRLEMVGGRVALRDLQFNMRHLLWTMLLLGAGMGIFHWLVPREREGAVSTAIWSVAGGVAIAGLMLFLSLRTHTLLRAIAFSVLVGIPWFAFAYGVEFTGIFGKSESRLMIADVHAVIAAWALLYGILWRMAGLRLIRQPKGTAGAGASGS